MAYPSNFNPTRTGGAKRGRPAKAVPGDALNSGARKGKGKGKPNRYANTRTHTNSGFLAPMLSFDPAVQDCGEVSLSLSVVTLCTTHTVAHARG